MAINNFVVNNLSALYIHTTKDNLYCGADKENEATRKVLQATFCVLSKVFWPIMPHLVEECWSYYGKSICLQERNEAVRTKVMNML